MQCPFWGPALSMHIVNFPSRRALILSKNILALVNNINLFLYISDQFALLDINLFLFIDGQFSLQNVKLIEVILSILNS